MMKFFRPHWLYMLVLILPTPAFSEPDAACRYGTREAWAEVEALFVGPWSIAHHAGYVIAGSMVLPFPASGPADTLQIEMLPSGQLVGTHPEAQAPIPFVWADEPPWSFEAHAANDGAPAPLLSSSDVEMLMGCGVEDLARLIGRTQVTMDGVVMDMTLRLMVVGPEQMYGIFHTSAVANGIPVRSWRAVTLTR